MRSVDMQKVTIFALNNEGETILKRIHKFGDLQLIDAKNEIDLPNTIQTEDPRILSDYLLRVSRIVNILKIPPRKLKLAQSLFGLDLIDKKTVPAIDYKQVIKDTKEFLNKNEKNIHELEDEYNKFEEKVKSDRELRKTIESFSELNLPLHLLKSTKNTKIIVGKILTAKLNSLKEQLSNTETYIHTKKEKKYSIVVLITHKENEDKISFISKKEGLNQFEIPDLPNVPDHIKWINQQIKSHKHTKENLFEKIKKEQKKFFEQAVILREELEIRKDKFDAINKLVNSESFFVLQGWVPKKRTDELKKVLKDCIVEIENPKKEDNPPVKLNNPKFLKPFEMLVELYALPKYKEIDPTFIVGPLFLIYAGFMLTDFVYGLVLLIAGIIILKKFGKYNESLKYICINLSFIGFFAMLFGFLTGSYLGDTAYYIFGKTTEQIAIWKDPLADPLYFLIISIGVGFIHLNFGLILGVIEDLKNKDYKTLVKDRIVWFLLQISIAVWALVSPLIGQILLGLTILLIIITSGPLGVLGMTGFMGDVISYSRLFALALSTAGICMTINLLADLVGGVPKIGILFTIIVFVGGNIFGLIMNTLGAFVHSIRLQFVEFFGKFYEGGGDKFTPYKQNRIYTQEEEK